MAGKTKKKTVEVTPGRTNKQLESFYGVVPAGRSVHIPIEAFPEGDQRRKEFVTVSGESQPIFSKTGKDMGRRVLYFDRITGALLEVEHYWGSDEDGHNKKVELHWLLSDPEENPAIAERVTIMEEQKPRPRQESARRRAKTKRSGKAGTAEASGGSTTRTKPFGKYFATAVLRWMGKDGFTNAQAAAALEGIGVKDISPSTVSIQVKAGTTEKRGAPADLSPTEIKKLRAFKKAPAAKKKVAAKKKTAAKKRTTKKRAKKVA